MVAKRPSRALISVIGLASRKPSKGGMWTVIVVAKVLAIRKVAVSSIYQEQEVHRGHH